MFQVDDEAVPTSNIDDVQITLNDSDPMEDRRVEMDNVHNEITVSHDRVVEPSAPTARAASSAPMKPAMKLQDSHESSSSHRPSHQPKGQAPQPGRTSTPPPPSPTQELVQNIWAPVDNVHVNGHTAESNSEVNISFSEDKATDRKRPSLTPSVNFTNSTPPTGTLADLKKQRAQQQLRNRDSDKYRNSISEDGNIGNSVYPPSERNGHSPGMVDSRSNSLTYLPDDRPKHRFTATNTEIIGGDDNKTNCCIIL